MAVYVDDARTRARVGRIRARWSPGEWVSLKLTSACAVACARLARFR